MGWFKLNPVIKNPKKKSYVIWWLKMPFREISENGEIPYRLGTSYEFRGMISYGSADMTVLLLGWDPSLCFPGPARCALEAHLIVLYVSYSVQASYRAVSSHKVAKHPSPSLLTSLCGLFFFFLNSRNLSICCVRLGCRERTYYTDLIPLWREDASSGSGETKHSFVK